MDERRNLIVTYLKCSRYLMESLMSMVKTIFISVTVIAEGILEKLFKMRARLDAKRYF